jgi:CHAD domain-containing protein
MLTNLTDLAQPDKITDTSDIHHIRIEFKKFRYMVEILSYIEATNSGRADKLKPYQDLLGEIHDYDVLMEGLEKFYTKKNEGISPDLEEFEKKQNTLIDRFENDLELFISVCQSAIRFDKSTPKNEHKAPDFVVGK